MAQAEETIRPQKLTSADFAAKIRAKHVGAYDDLSDDDLTRKVLTKYPQYNDLTDMPAPSMPNEVKGTDFVMGENGARPVSIRTPETQSRVRNYKDLSNIVGGQGFTVTSTTGGRHNVGSAHYQGRAVDIRTRDKTPAQIEALMNNLRSSGIDVRDERVRPKGQEVWGGPHIHAQVSPPAPTPVNQTQDSTATPKRAVASRAARPPAQATAPDPNFTFARPVRNDDFQQKLYQSERATRETQGQVDTLPSKLERFMQSAATPGNVETMAARPDPDAQARTQLRRQIAAERREQARVHAQVPDLSPESVNREAEQRLQAGRENEAEQARLLGQFEPEDYANAKAIHDRIVSEPRYARAIDAGLANVVGASVREVAGALNLPIRAVQALANTPGTTQNETVDRLRRAALSAEMGAEQGKREAGFSRGEGLAQSGTELVGNLAKLALLTKGAGALGVPARAITPLVFGGQGVAAASGENKSLADVIAEGAKGAAEGELFNVAHELPMAADSIGQRLLRTGAQVGTVGAGTYGAERLAGASPEQAKQAALTNAAFVGVPAVAGEVARGVGEVAERRALRSRENDLQAAMLQREGVRPNEVETAPNLQETVVNEQGGQAPNLPPTQKQYRHADFDVVTETENQSGIAKGHVRVVDEQGAEHVIQRPNGRGQGNNLATPIRRQEGANEDITQSQATDTASNITPTTTGGAGAQGGRTESRRTAQPLATATSVSEVPANAPPQRTVEAQSTSRVVPSGRLAQTTGGQSEVTIETSQFQPMVWNGSKYEYAPTDPRTKYETEGWIKTSNPDLSITYKRPTRIAPLVSPPALPTEKTQTPSSGWVDRLDEGTRESVFAEMRAVRAESDRSATQARNLSAPQGTIAVGAADFDPFIRAEAQATFLRELGKGKTPAEAETAAKQFAREAVVKHNAKRPNDVNWARWEGTADSVIERTRTRVERAAKGSVVPPTPTEKPTTLPTMPTEGEKLSQRPATPLEQPISRQAGPLTPPPVKPERGEHGHFAQSLFKETTAGEGDSVLSDKHVQSALGFKADESPSLTEVSERLRDALGVDTRTKISPELMRKWAQFMELPAGSHERIDRAEGLYNQKRQTIVGREVELTRKIAETKKPTRYQQTGVRESHLDTQTHTLSEAVRRLGGIKPGGNYVGELRTLSNKERVTSGIIAHNGENIEFMGKMLLERGYPLPTEDGINVDPSDLIEAIHADIDGRRVMHSTEREPDYEAMYRQHLAKSATPESQETERKYERMMTDERADFLYAKLLYNGTEALDNAELQQLRQKAQQYGLAEEVEHSIGANRSVDTQDVLQERTSGTSETPEATRSEGRTLNVATGKPAGEAFRRRPNERGAVRLTRRGQPAKPEQGRLPGQERGPFKDVSSIDYLRSRLSNLDFAGTYERRGGVAGKKASDLIRQHQIAVVTGRVDKPTADQFLARSLRPLVRQFHEQGQHGLAQWVDAHLQAIRGQQNAPFATVANFLKGAQYNLKLRFNLKSRVVNELQPLQTLWPYTTTREFFGLAAEARKPSVQKRLQDIGVLSTGIKTEGQPRRRYLPDLFGKASDYNRAMGYLYGEMDGRRRGLDGLKLQRHAFDWAKRVEFDSSKYDSIPILSGNVASVLGQFKGFTVKNIESIIHDLKRHEGDKFGGWAARAGKRITSQLVVGGVRSIPGGKQIGTLVLLGGLATALQKAGMDEDTANKTAETVYYGAPSLIGADLSGSTMILDPPYGDTVYEQLVNYFGGPSVSMLAGLATQGKRFALAKNTNKSTAREKRTNAVRGAVKQVTPYYRTYESASQAVRGEQPHITVSGGKEIPLTKLQSFLRAGQFTPVTQTKYYDETEGKAQPNNRGGRVPSRQSTTSRQ